MKKIIFKKQHLALFSLLTLFVWGCQKQSTITQKQDAQKIKISSEDFNFIGESHNDALDFIFQTAIAGKNNATYSEITDASKKYFFEVNTITKGTKDNPSYLSFSSTKKDIRKAVYSKSIIADESLLKQKLTSNQFFYLKKLDNVISIFKGDDLSGLLGNLKAIENEAIVTLSDNEIVYILAVSNLAKYSLTYWNSTKADKWYSYFNNRSNSNVAAKIDYHNVAVADIGAFAVGFPAGVNVGALVGGLTAGIASGGITAGLGAILGGAVGGTVSGLAAAASASAIVLGAEIAADWFGW